MLKDSRVNVNEPNKGGRTPLRCAAGNGHLEIIRWWIASGREVDLGTPGDQKTDAILAAMRNGKQEVVTVLELFKRDATQIRHMTRVELGVVDAVAAEVFALVVFVSDGLLQVKDITTTTPAARFFSIATQLPLELQMVLCFRQVGLHKEIIPGKDSEAAFNFLAIGI